MASRMINTYLQLYPASQDDPITDRQAVRTGEKCDFEPCPSEKCEDRTLQLVMEELLLQESSRLTRQLAGEVLNTCKAIRLRTDTTFMETTEAVATGADHGRDPKDPAYNLTTKTYFTTEKYRDTYMDRVWAHSQPLEQISAVSGTEEAEAGDVRLLEFDKIIPMSLRPGGRPHDTSYRQDNMTCEWSEYCLQEAAYWRRMVPNVSSVSLARRTLGVVTARSSPNHQLLALGTAHGDIIIYNLMTSPWQPMRTLLNEPKSDHDPIIDLCWNATGTHIITINLSGMLQMWAIHGLKEPCQTDLKKLDLGRDARGVNPEQLAQLLHLDSEKSDFTFKRGPLAEAGVHDAETQYFPDLAVFYPSFTLLGLQPYVCIALHTGDIIRINIDIDLQQRGDLARQLRLDQETPISNGTDHKSTEKRESFPRTYINTHENKLPSHSVTKQKEKLPPNMIGQGIEAEFLRQHKSPVLLVGFVNNVGGMVSVDEMGYVFIWTDSLVFLTNYGWFQPSHKFRLSLSKVMYHELKHHKPKVIFTNEKKDLTRRQIGKQRQRVEDSLKELNLRDLWHEEDNKEQSTKVCIYLPKEGACSEVASEFHAVERHQRSGYLYSYSTRLYEPVKVNSTRLLGVKLTPDGNELVFLLLFPEFPPKDPMISVVRMDLQTKDLKDFHCTIDLTAQQYTQCLHENVVAFDVSKTLAPTGAPYLFINYTGLFSVISLVSGQTVLKVDNPKYPDPGFVGCRIPWKNLCVPSESEVVVSCPTGHLVTTLFYHGEEKKHQSQLTVVDLVDNNPASTRKKTWEATKKWLRGRSLPPRGQRIDRTLYTLSPPAPPTAWAITLLLECVDRAVQEVDGPFSERQQAESREGDKEFVYKKAIAKVHFGCKEDNASIVLPVP